jgi:ERCC4-related helicase
MAVFKVLSGANRWGEGFPLGFGGLFLPPVLCRERERGPSATAVPYGVAPVDRLLLQVLDLLMREEQALAVAPPSPPQLRLWCPTCRVDQSGPGQTVCLVCKRPLCPQAAHRQRNGPIEFPELPRTNGASAADAARSAKSRTLQADRLMGSSRAAAPSKGQMTLAMNPGGTVGVSTSPPRSAADAATSRIERRRTFDRAEAESLSERAHRGALASLEVSASETWEFPRHRDYPERPYQLAIVQTALFHNTLVSLPTGLGKTFIAAVVMHNYRRWFPDGTVVFMAPTKPLVTQQVEACHKIVGIPPSDTAQLLGAVSVKARVEAWGHRPVVYCTPQTFANDLKNGRVDPRKVVLIVFDEAHRATGNYAYCSVVQEMDKVNTRYRVLALSATPGKDLERVQGVIDALHISAIEARSDGDPDVAKFTFGKTIDKITVNLSHDLNRFVDIFADVLRPVSDRLAKMGIIPVADPKKLSTMMLVASMNNARANPGKFPAIPEHAWPDVMGSIAVLQRLCPAMKELSLRGTLAFWRSIQKFAKEANDTRAKRAVLALPAWQTMVTELARLEETGEHVLHPKLIKLGDTLREHFQRHSAAGGAAFFRADDRQSSEPVPSTSRVIVFTETRNSVAELLKYLKEYCARWCKCAAFVGQAGAKKSAGSEDAASTGQSQREQAEVVANFRAGKINTLIATCIGEEGLDIGEVGLIVLFDASGSPIRTVQRIGRTGRQKAGEIVALVTPGSETSKFDLAFRKYRNVSRALRIEQGRFRMCSEAPAMVPASSMLERVNFSIGEFRLSQVAGVSGVRAVARPTGATDIRKAMSRSNYGLTPSQSAFVEQAFASQSSMRSLSVGRGRIAAARPRSLPPAVAHMVGRSSTVSLTAPGARQGTRAGAFARLTQYVTAMASLGKDAALVEERQVLAQLRREHAFNEYVEDLDESHIAQSDSPIELDQDDEDDFVGGSPSRERTAGVASGVLGVIRTSVSRDAQRDRTSVVPQSSVSQRMGLVLPQRAASSDFDFAGEAAANGVDYLSDSGDSGAGRVDEVARIPVVTGSQRAKRSKQVQRPKSSPSPPPSSPAFMHPTISASSSSRAGASPPRQPSVVNNVVRMAPSRAAHLEALSGGFLRVSPDPLPHTARAMGAVIESFEHDSPQPVRHEESFANDPAFLDDTQVSDASETLDVPVDPTTGPAPQRLFEVLEESDEESRQSTPIQRLRRNKQEATITAPTARVRRIDPEIAGEFFDEAAQLSGEDSGDDEGSEDLDQNVSGSFIDDREPSQFSQASWSSTHHQRGGMGQREWFPDAEKMPLAAMLLQQDEARQKRARDDQDKGVPRAKRSRRSELSRELAELQAGTLPSSQEEREFGYKMAKKRLRAPPPSTDTEAQHGVTVAIGTRAGGYVEDSEDEDFVVDDLDESHTADESSGNIHASVLMEPRVVPRGLVIDSGSTSLPPSNPAPSSSSSSAVLVPSANQNASIPSQLPQPSPSKHSAVFYKRLEVFTQLGIFESTKADQVARESVEAKIKIADIIEWLPPEIVRKVPCLSIREAAQLRAHLRRALNR